MQSQELGDIKLTGLEVLSEFSETFYDMYEPAQVRFRFQTQKLVERLLRGPLPCSVRARRINSIG